MATGKKKITKPVAQEKNEPPKDRPGICDRCGCGKFSLKIGNVAWIRTCVRCGDEREV
jgi:hypothetical protein